MSPSLRVLAGVAFSVVATLCLMCVVSRFPGMAIPSPYWLFGAACPALISTPVCILLVRNAERNRVLNGELAEALRRLRLFAEIDQMTGMLNRSTFFDRAEARHALGRGWFLLIDIDHFKAINDGYGHDTGDRALQAVAGTLLATVRHDALCGRIGGEEFAIHLTGINREEAMKIAEDLRVAVEALAVEADDGTMVCPTISIGLAGGIEIGGVREGLRVADAAMYDAKHGGRNRVKIAA